LSRNGIKGGGVMKFRIHNRKYEDYIVIEGETIEEIKEIAKHETGVRGWEDKDMWSYQIADNYKEATK